MGVEPLMHVWESRSVYFFLDVTDFRVSVSGNGSQGLILLKVSVAFEMLEKTGAKSGRKERWMTEFNESQRFLCIFDPYGKFYFNVNRSNKINLFS